MYQELSGPVATLTPCDSSGNPLSTSVFIAAANDTKVDGTVDPNMNNLDSTDQPIQLLESDDETIYQPAKFLLTLYNGTKYLVDADGNLLSITDRNGNTVSFTYNGTGNRVLGVSHWDHFGWQPHHENCENRQLYYGDHGPEWEYVRLFPGRQRQSVVGDGSRR